MHIPLIEASRPQISREPSPKLAKPEAWSSALHDFVSLSLLKNAEQRPSAVELLKHAFITSSAKARRFLFSALLARCSLRSASAVQTGPECIVAEVARTREWLASQRAAAPAGGAGGSLPPPAGGGATVVRSFALSCRACRASPALPPPRSARPPATRRRAARGVTR